MIWRFMLGLALSACMLALIAVPLWLRSNSYLEPSRLQTAKSVLLWIAGTLFAFIGLIGLAAGAWGMDITAPWGLGVYPFLLLVLGLPSFLLLRFASVQALSRTIWGITILFPFAWYLADRAESLSKGWIPPSSPREILGTFFNAFTLVLIPAAILVHLAAMCQKRIRAQAASEFASRSPGVDYPTA